MRFFLTIIQSSPEMRKMWQVKYFSRTNHKFQCSGVRQKELTKNKEILNRSTAQMQLRPMRAQKNKTDIRFSLVFLGCWFICTN